MAASLTDFLRRRRCGEAPLFSHADGRNRLAYDTCWRLVDAHERWLREVVDDRCRDADAREVGGTESVVVGDVIVGYLADNSPDLLLSVLACIHLTTRSASSVGGVRARIVPAMINGRWTPAEIERALRPSTSAIEDDAFREGRLRRVHWTIVMYGGGHRPAAEEAVHLMNRQREHLAVALPLPELACKYYDAPSVSTAESVDINRAPPEDESLSNDDALLLFTSGTSSPKGAKGVRLSHRALLVQARAKTQHPCHYDEQTRLVATTVPWFHVGGMSSALAVMFGGGCLVFPSGSDGRERRGFQPERVLETIRSKSVAANTLVVVPAMLHALAAHAKENAQDCPTVRLILVGGQSIGSGRLYEQTRTLFPKARIVQTYACTEAGSSITFEDLGWAGDANLSGGSSGEDSGMEEMDAATSVGHPPSHIQIGIFDANANKSMGQSTLPHGTMGIIGTRGPHVMSGYWNRGGDNSSSLDPNYDWMLTNDLGYIDPQSGKLFFCGRANDVIRTGGESVLATEVERVIGLLPVVVECSVFALPDEKFGEAVCVAVVLEKALDLSLAERAVIDEQWKEMIRQHCAEHQLAGFKRPRRVFCMDALPRNSSGKVLKHEIMRRCAALSNERSRL